MRCSGLSRILVPAEPLTQNPCPVGEARGQHVLWGRSGVSISCGRGGARVSPCVAEVMGRSGVSPSCGGLGSAHPAGEVRGQPILWGGQGSACPVGARGQRGPWHWERLSCPSCVAPRLRSAPWRPLGGPSSSPAFYRGTLTAGSSPQDTFLQLLVSGAHPCTPVLAESGREAPVFFPFLTSTQVSSRFQPS